MGWFHNTELNEIQELIELGKLPEAQTKLKARFKRRFDKKELSEVMLAIDANFENFLDFQKWIEFQLKQGNQERALKDVKAAKRTLKRLKKNINHLVNVEKILEE